MCIYVVKDGFSRCETAERSSSVGGAFDWGRNDCYIETKLQGSHSVVHSIGSPKGDRKSFGHD